MEDRTKFIGSTDAPALLGLSRWQTPLELWAEKTGLVAPEDISDRMSIRVGKKLEDTVAEFFTEETGKKVRRVNEHRVHKQYPFICAQIDRIVENEDAIVELKTASGWKAKEWSGEEIPREYEIQVIHQLAVTGKPIGYIAVLIGNQDFKVKQIEYDKKVIASLIEKEVKFWNECVVPKVMPLTITADDNDILYKIYPDVQIGEDIALPEQTNIYIEQIQSALQDKIAIEEIINKNKNELKALLKQSGQGHTGLWRITWKEQITKRLDIDKLKKEQQEIYNRYLNESKGRTLRYKQITKKEE